MKRPFLLSVYRGATRLAEAAGPAFLRRRLRQGKEDPGRLGERLGHPGAARPPGPLAWVHGASVGEGLALLPFIERLAGRGFRVLVTTGTVSSSRVLAARLPAGTIHHFVPLDLPGAARRFFDHWRPDLVCFAESELWPNLLGEAAQRAIPSVLLNARMSERSFARWRRLPAVIAPLLQGFTAVLAQSPGDAERLGALGAVAVSETGNLKFDVPPPVADAAELAAFTTAIAGRPAWVAASTHAGEEEACLAAHEALSATYPGLVTIIVPRKADRGPAIVALAAAQGLAAQGRSVASAFEPATTVYVADTMGDLGLFYRLAPIVLVGKSLVDGGGGQNPIEPAKLGCAILHGPHVANFFEVYAALDAAGGGLAVADPAALAGALSGLLSDPARRDAMAAAAAACVSAAGGATDRIMLAIEPICASILRDRR